MGSGVCLRRCAMRTVAGEFGDESRAARRFNGARARAVHVLVARSARSGRALSESARPMTSLIGTVMPYDERGHVCVRCMVLCVALRVPGGQCVSHITCRVGRARMGPRNVDSYYTNFSFAFWTVCQCNTSKESDRYHQQITSKPLLTIGVAPD